MDFTPEELIRLATSTIGSENIRQRFSVGVSCEQMYALITEAYKVECKHRGMTFVDDEPTKERLQSCADWLTNSRKKFGLLLYGGVGNGKSTTMRAIARSCSSLKDAARKTLEYNHLKMTSEQHRTYENILYNTPDFAIITAQMIAAYAKDAKDGNLDNWTKVQRTAYLAIDDLGCEPVAVKNYGTEVTPVIDILYQRYDTLAPTIITTNLDMKDIRGRYRDRVADRFNEMFELIGFKTKSYRR